ncbi:carbohydrate ABC transporter permease [Paenibacillus qinlingensis]|uniref:Aldouronate transport system permease protein n=1 Tax=Paenibacillus qinlingensis TaxID=1837343 RepID=A0ABU1P2C6_9BACL|nr:carbohydrate ABC transporter permease [Paenibacillus qinlingensis]MDR6553895.1 putative aldouronate transport system permease protein [Paenibacillus qinlingensis]
MNRTISKSERYVDVIIYALLILVTAAILLPLLYVVTASFAPEEEYLTRGFFLFPHKWTWEGYQYLLTNPGFINAFKSALIISIFGTLINIVLTTLMAYGLSKVWLKERSLISFMVLFTMLFTGGMIPTYMVVKGLGLLDSYWSLWLTSAIAPFHLIVMRSFFRSVPDEVLESSNMDGCGEWRTLWSIVLPLSLPAIATFTLFYLVHNWNTYFNAILYLNDATKWPLQVYLRQMLIDDASATAASIEQSVNYTPAAKMSAILLTAFPLLIIYPFLQKYFNKGMLLGSVKG